jgi:FlaA1/EpsC-like NDP-sugar epimerase
MKIESNIIVIGEAGELQLLIKKSNVNNALAKCAVVQHDEFGTNLLKTYDNIQIPLKFNPFEEVIKSKSDNKLIIFNQRMVENEIKEINDFLK